MYKYCDLPPFMQFLHCESYIKKNFNISQNDCYYLIRINVTLFNISKKICINRKFYNKFEQKLLKKTKAILDKYNLNFYYELDPVYPKIHIFKNNSYLQNEWQNAIQAKQENCDFATYMKKNYSCFCRPIYYCGSGIIPSINIPENF